MTQNMFGCIMLFARTISPSAGGMETHQVEMMKNCMWVVTLDYGYSVYFKKNLRFNGNLRGLIDFLNIIILQDHIRALFMNDASFLIISSELRNAFPSLIFLLRSGGNDIYRAPWENDDIPLHIRQENIRKAINENINIFIVNSDFSYLRSLKFGIRKDIIKKVRGGVDITECRYNIQRKTKYRLSLNTKFCCEDKILLLFACRMKKFKGITEFLHAFFSFPNWNNFFLVFIGDGEMINCIMQVIHKNNAEDHVAFLGKLSHLETMKYIACADYVINTSLEERRISGGETYIHTETMGRTMIEAISENVPLIATQVGGIPELFFENPNAGYMITDFREIPSILHIIENKKQPFDQINALTISQYSWNNVFVKYRQLIAQKICRKVLCMDLDNTLITTNTDIDHISKLISSVKNKICFIINTARTKDQETVNLCKNLNADYVIYENGRTIVSPSSDYLWNNSFTFYPSIVIQINKLYQKLCTIFPESSVTLTHPHIIQIRPKGGVTCSLRNKLKNMLEGTDFIFVYSDSLVKIVNRFCSKEAALFYILKDMSYSKLYCAGDSLNDLLFVRDADEGWIASDLKIPSNRFNYLHRFNKSIAGE